VSESEGVGTVSDQLPDDVLRRAFQALSERAVEDVSLEDRHRVWQALHGEIPALERAAVVDRLASDPALAEAWRIAHALQYESDRQRRGARAAAPAGRARSAWRQPVWLSLAATLLIATTSLLVVVPQRHGDATFRAAGRYAVEPLIAHAELLPRDAFALRWNAAPEGARYRVRVTAEDLRLLMSVEGLTEPSVTVDPARLATLPSGSIVFWQVEAVLPDGELVVSPTFVSRLR
jgi:hypothetical protein